MLKAGLTENVADDGTESVFEDLVATVQTPVRQGAVPSTAVHTGPSGQQCVFTIADAHAALTAAEPVPLNRAHALEGEVALAGVDTDLIGTRIVRTTAQLDAATLGKCS